MVHCAQSFSSSFSAPSRCSRFEVHAVRCAQILPRIVGVFARLDLLPIDLHARRSCGGMWIALTVDIEGADAERAAEKLRATVGVDAVMLVTPPRAAAEIAPPCAAVAAAVAHAVVEVGIAA